MPCWMFSSILAFYPLDARRNTWPHLELLTTKNVFWSCQMSPGDKVVPVKSCWFMVCGIAQGAQIPCTGVNTLHPSVSWSSFTRGQSLSFVQPRLLLTPCRGISLAHQVLCSSSALVTASSGSQLNYTSWGAFCDPPDWTRCLLETSILSFPAFHLIPIKTGIRIRSAYIY